MDKPFAWAVFFPLIPWVLGVSAALGCDLAGVNTVPWVLVIAVLTIVFAVLFTWYGLKKYRELEP